MHGGERERERESNSAHGRKLNGLTRVFTHRSETHFDLRVVMDWVLPERTERQNSLKSTPPVEGLCTRVRSPPPPLFNPWAGEPEEPWQQWARSKVIFLI